MLLDHLPYCLAAGRCPASEQGLDILLRNQPLRLLGAIFRVGPAIDHDRLDLPPVYTPFRVCLLDRQVNGVDQWLLADRRGARERMQHSDTDTQLGPRVVLPYRDAYNQQHGQQDKRDTPLMADVHHLFSGVSPS